MSNVRMSVRKTGSKSYPWEVRCSGCVGPSTHLIDGVGVVAINTTGLGNRLWHLAMLAVRAHLLWHIESITCSWPGCTRPLNIPGSPGIGGALCLFHIYNL